LSEVLFLPAGAEAAPEAVGARVARMYDALDLPSRLPAGALVAVKLHFGEPGRRAPIPPAWLQPAIARLREAGTQPFLTDTCTLYRGGRSHAVAHLRTAAARGYSLAETGVPVVIADGLIGEAGVEVPIAGEHFRSAWIAGAAVRAAAILNCAHFTGHIGTGFGAAIKNLGMGLAARAGKLQQHAGAAPQVESPWILPEVWGPLKSFLVLPTVQLFAYEMAVYLGKDVDQPRNLAKSVTVE